jgi:hypothetical protein
MVAAILILVGTVTILDEGYIGALLGPISVVGGIAWCLSGVLHWRKWSMALLPIFVIPFLPWS